MEHRLQTHCVILLAAKVKVDLSPNKNEPNVDAVAE